MRRLVPAALALAAVLLTTPLFAMTDQELAIMLKEAGNGSTDAPPAQVLEKLRAATYGQEVTFSGMVDSIPMPIERVTVGDTQSVPRRYAGVYYLWGTTLDGGLTTGEAMQAEAAKNGVQPSSRQVGVSRSVEGVYMQYRVAVPKETRATRTGLSVGWAMKITAITGTATSFTVYGVASAPQQ